MKLLLTGALLASLAVIALYVYTPRIAVKVLARGDENEWGDECKQPTYRYYGERLIHD